MDFAEALFLNMAFGFLGLLLYFFTMGLWQKRKEKKKNESKEGITDTNKET